MNITREQGQQMVVDAYNKSKHVLVLYATGFGKAKAALDAVSSNPGRRGLIVVHSEVSRDVTWPEQIKTWAPHLYDMEELIICCYQSLKSLSPGYNYDWVIVDEAHYLTPNYVQFFRENDCKSIILLTATMPEDQIKTEMLMSLARRNVLRISLDEATKSGVLNEYQVSLWYIEMTPLEKSAYLVHCAAVQNAFNTNNSNFINMKLGERMRFIYNLESKYKAAVYLRDQIRETGKRNIIFCGSIDMANKISPYRYHSGVGDTDYQRFLNEEIKELASIKQIQEGANIPSLESALVVQINSKQLNLVQKLGRLMRLEEGAIAKMHIIAVRDTVDVNWLHKAIKGLDKNKIKEYILERELFDPLLK